MTAFKRGDVVLVAFPFTDLTTSKRRPALIISSDLLNSKNQDCILVAISSNVRRRLPTGDIILSLEDQKLAGLPKPSVVRTGKIVTIDQRLIRKKLGRLGQPILGYLTSEIHKTLS